MLIDNKRIYAIAGLALVTAGVSGARGSILASDPFSISTPFTGTVTVDNTGTTGTLDAQVDYAVFAPGTFPGPSGGGNINGVVDLFGGSPTNLTNIPEYVYAYVVNNLPGSNLPVNSMSIGLETGANFHNIGDDPSLPGSTPIFQYTPANSFISLFSSIAPGSGSDVIIFTSTEPPTFQSSTIGNGGLNDQVLLPSPAVPEPAGIALLSVAGAGILKPRRRHAGK